MSISLTSGQEYSLSQIFCDDRKIVIPDLQRDYCWSDKAWNKDHEQYRELVTGFVDNLLSSFEEAPNEKLLLGLVYGYEHPKNQVQLCDGQQRITTLFLILGILNRLAEFEFSKYLISDEEINDDREPYLCYAIRESTLYFTSDLVSEFFLKKNESLKQLKDADWYFLEYNQDPSIQSMINALKIIEEKLVLIEDKSKFGNFILNNLNVLYYDMEDRVKGEETFVVINTTGEPLTASENLKPILLGNIIDIEIRNESSSDWELREEWFWRNKQEEEATSDEGHQQFFIWYWQIRLLQERAWKRKTSFELNPIELFQKKPKVVIEDEEKPDVLNWAKSIESKTFQSYFQALECLIKFSTDDRISKVLNTIEDSQTNLTWFRNAPIHITLPLLAYLQKFNDNDEYFYQFVRKLRKNYWDKEWEDRKSKYVDWRHILQVIEFSENVSDVLVFDVIKNEEKFKKIAGVDLNIWYSEEDEIQNNFKLINKVATEDWEDHINFMGDLSFLLHLGSDQSFDFESVTEYYNNYSEMVDLVADQRIVKESNIYRLFMLLIDVQKIGHQYNMSSGISGVIFSSIDRTHLFNNDFKKMCLKAHKDIFMELILAIKQKIKEQDLLVLTEANFSVEKALKCWLILKSFHAFKDDVCLSYHDGNKTGVSIFDIATKNKIFDAQIFSMYNFICGFGVKKGGGIRYANIADWNKAGLIDNPFVNIPHQIDDRNNSGIVENKEEIDEIIAYIENL